VENFFSRYRNASLLVLVLVAQVVGLGVQVRRSTEAGGTRLIRFWVVSGVTPIEKSLVNSGHSVRNVWRNYLYLRGVRQENRDLKAEVERLRIEQVRLSEDAAQARRLQTLLGFKEQFISQTVAAQVIGTSGSDQSHVVYIDKGSNDGVKPDMAVITPDGIVGKVLRVFHSSAQVLLINDSSSGVGAMLESSRLQGILQGTAAGETMLKYVMSDEKVATGERVLTSGGDRIFPKGLPIGAVQQTNPGSDLFLNIRVKPAADLSRLEEVLVVTRMVETTPKAAELSGQVRAADILAERLPSVPPKLAAAPSTVAATKLPSAAASPGPSASMTAVTGTTPSATAQSQASGAAPTAKLAVNAGKPSTHSASGVTPEASATNSSMKPSGTASSTGTTGAKATDAAAKPAVAKPVSNRPTASEGQKTKPINSAGQPAKPATAAPPPAQEVAR
jgi:rod shape-determining protein MreC